MVMVTVGSLWYGWLMGSPKGLDQDTGDPDAATRRAHWASQSMIVRAPLNISPMLDSV